MGWARAGRFGASGDWIPKILLKLVRSVEITANFHRCKKYFDNFVTEGRYEGNRPFISEPDAARANLISREKTSDGSATNW
jgi:hypothetical protein